MNINDRSAFSEELSKLSEPFEVEDVYWLPQSVRGGKAQAAAYANKRCYAERMDSVLGPERWQIEIDSPVTTEYTKNIKAKLDWKTKEEVEPARTENGTKIMVKARAGVWIPYLSQWVWKASTGVAPSDDENSITTAEAQAVKRAISMWGPGKYFYDLPTQMVPYAEFKFTVTPTLPDWAIPKRVCHDCTKQVTPFTYEAKGIVNTLSATDVLKRGQANYKTDLCAECQTKRKNTK